MTLVAKGRKVTSVFFNYTYSSELSAIAASLKRKQDTKHNALFSIKCSKFHLVCYDEVTLKTHKRADLFQTLTMTMSENHLIS